MAKTHHYREVDGTYFDAAPAGDKLRQSIPASAAATFRSFEDAEAWPQWLDAIDEVTWTTPQPFGVGTTREIKGRAGVISEYFFAWDNGRRMSFFFDRGPLRVVGAFAEDYELVPTGDDSCELVWRYAFECPGGYRVLQPLIAFVFKRMGTKWLGQLAEFMAQHGAQYG